tara:strand:+ start:86 stop:238 length:153 start_codon:yes stop_codon:yes gene_type:complete
MMEDVKLYSLTLFSLVVSSIETLNSYLQGISLLIAIVYGLYQIKKISKNG